MADIDCCDKGRKRLRLDEDGHCWLTDVHFSKTHGPVIVKYCPWCGRPVDDADQPNPENLLSYRAWRDEVCGLLGIEPSWGWHVVVELGTRLRRLENEAVQHLAKNEALREAARHVRRPLVPGAEPADADIENVWYVQALKALAEEHDANEAR